MSFVRLPMTTGQGKSTFLSIWSVKSNQLLILIQTEGVKLAERNLWNDSLFMLNFKV